MDPNQIGVGLQHSYVPFRGKEVTLPAGTTCLGSDKGAKNLVGVAYCPIDGPASCTDSNRTESKSYDGLSKLMIVKEWLDQFPLSMQKIYLAGVGGNPGVPNTLVKTLDAITNQELVCLANGLNGFVCQGNDAADPVINDTSSCKIPGAKAVKDSDGSIAALASSILDMRLAQVQDSVRTKETFGDQAGCQNINAIEWASRTGLPSYNKASKTHGDNSMTPQCTLNFPKGETVENVCQTIYGGNPSSSCTNLQNPLDAGAYAEKVCDTMAVNPPGFDCHSMTKKECTLQDKDPYCQCIRETKMATLSSQGSAARCCFETGPASKPQKKLHIPWWVWLAIGGGIILIVAIAVPIVIHKKHSSQLASRKSAIMHEEETTDSHLVSPDFDNSGIADDSLSDQPLSDTLPADFDD